MDTGDKKKKQKPYSEYEKQLLMQLVQSKIDIVENRRTDGTTQKKKSEAWEDITRQFNNSPNLSQTASAAQLKKMWQNMKSKARDAKTLDAQKKWTGGGPAPPSIGSEDTQVLSIIPSIMPTINVDIDSDIIEASTSHLSQEMNDDDSIYWQPANTRDIDVTIIGEEVINYDPVPACSPQEATNQIPSAAPKKRKAEESLDDLKKQLVKKEIEKTAQEMRHKEEKHQVELEILKFKRDLLKKEFENKNN